MKILFIVLAVSSLFFPQMISANNTNCLNILKEFKAYYSCANKKLCAVSALLSYLAMSNLFVAVKPVIAHV